MVRNRPFTVAYTCIVSPSRIPQSQNLARNFDDHGISRFGAENHRKGGFPWHWENLPFSEHRIFIFERGISFCFINIYLFIEVYKTHNAD